MAQGEFWVERQNWARWPRVLKVNRVTDSGTETRRYVPKGADWKAKDYATRKIAELQADNAKLRELVSKIEQYERRGCYGCPHEEGCTSYTLYNDDCPMRLDIERDKRELGLGVEVDR